MSTRGKNIDLFILCSTKTFLYSTQQNHSLEDPLHLPVKWESALRIPDRPISTTVNWW